MSSPKKTVCLNLGMQTVTAACFSLSAEGGLVLTHLSRSSLLPDPAADASRAGQLKIALGELRPKLHLGGARCAIAIPSQRTFTRFVKIPRVAPEQVGQMLFYEAQQNIPHAIEEVSWAYQVLPEGDPEKLGTIIVATKLEDIEPTVDAVRAAGFSPDLIETAPVAIYNALRFNYPSLEGCSLVIDIGARTTDLVFAEGDRLFVRTLPTGANAITAALQKSLGGQPPAAVEEFKLREGRIPPPGSHSDEASHAAEAGKIARTVMTRIHNEVARSITFYRTNCQGSAPVRVFLAGGGVSMSGTLEFFNEKLALPVEYFNPLRRVTVAGSVDATLLQQSAHCLGESTGMATRLLLGDCPLEVELRSPSAAAAARDRKRRPFLLVSAGILATAIAISFLHYRSAACTFSSKIDEADGRIRQLNEFKEQIDSFQESRSKMLSDAAELASVPLLRTAWASILDELSSRMPARNIWITELRPAAGSETAPASGDGDPPAVAKGSDANSGQEITALALNGLYLDNDSGPGVVDEFVDSLAACDLFRIDPEKKGEVVKLRAAQTGDAWAYEYQLVLPLRRPIPL